MPPATPPSPYLSHLWANTQNRDTNQGYLSSPSRFVSYPPLVAIELSGGRQFTELTEGF